MTIFNWIIIGITIVGWAVTYGRLMQKINELEKHQDITDNTYVRKDVFNAQHNEICAQVKELCDLKLPAALARIETSQEQLIVDVARLQTSVQKLLEK